jgi:hypothetical protein
MKSLIILLLITCLLDISNNPAEGKKGKILQTRNSKEIIQLINGKKLYVNDSTQYSQQFIKGLRSDIQHFDSLILIDDTLHVFYTMRYKDKIFHNVQLSHLPTDLPLGKPVMYSTEKNGKKYFLTLIRTNFTDIKFYLKIDGNTTKTGLVILGSTFFLGDESIEENGIGYFLSQYLSDNYFVKSDQESSVLLKVQIGSGERVSYHEHFSYDWSEDIEVVLRRQ